MSTPETTAVAAAAGIAATPPAPRLYINPERPLVRDPGNPDRELLSLREYVLRVVREDEERIVAEVTRHVGRKLTERRHAQG